MRKLALVLLATLFSVPAESVAQVPSFGLKGGLNMATFSGQRIVLPEKARTSNTFEIR